MTRELAWIFAQAVALFNDAISQMGQRRNFGVTNACPL